MRIEKIIRLPQGSKISICKMPERTLLSRTKYKTDSCDSPYYKMVFDDHSILVVSPEDKFMYYGYIIPDIPYDYPTPNEVFVGDEKFVFSARDTQRVLEVEFGENEYVEREVDYSDYESADNAGKILSVAVILSSGKRADVYAKVISCKDIKSK